MTRILPWLKRPDQSTDGVRSSSANPAKRQRLAAVVSDQEASATALQPKTMIQNRRNPSSSPPPMQPPPSSPLRPGLQADDIFIMVEDEFLATAQTFTKHLHRAAYQDIKRKAKLRQVRDASDISRPTDGVTRMGAELKQRKRADAVHKKAKKGVDALLASAARNRGPGSDDSDSDFDVNKLDPPDHGWQGTQLHQFVMNRPNENLKSLTGVHRVKSHTRAAAGFAKEGSKATRETSPMNRSEDDETQDTDDLDGPTVRKKRPAQFPTMSQPKKQHPIQKSMSKLKPKPGVNCRPPTSPGSIIHETSDTDSSADSDFPVRNTYQGQARTMSHKANDALFLSARLQARRGLEKHQQGKKHGIDDRPRVEEIPLFI